MSENGARTFEEWATEKAAHGWLVSAARFAYQLPVGKELSEADFDHMMEKAAHLEMLPSSNKPDSRRGK